MYVYGCDILVSHGVAEHPCERTPPMPPAKYIQITMGKYKQGGGSARTDVSRLHGILTLTFLKHGCFRNMGTFLLAELSGASRYYFHMTQESNLDKCYLATYLTIQVKVL